MPIEHSTTVQDGVDLVNAVKWNADHTGDLNLPFPAFTSKPTPDASYLRKMIVVRTGSGAKSYIYVCVLNDANGYEWVLIGVST